MRPWRYLGRWALVTGASAGIGAEFAAQLAGRGCNLVLSARREERLEELAAHLKSRHGIDVAVVAANLFGAGEPERLWREASAVATIDLLVNNAGFGAKGPFHEVPLAGHLEVVRLNCTALLELTHFALTEMAARGDGAIINVASIAANQPVPNLATYAASKAFVLSLTNSLWAENHRRGVRVLALSTGRTPTEFQAIAGTGSAVGAFGVRTPAQVVTAALGALDRGRITEIPGIENRLVAWAIRMMPRGLGVRLIREVLPRFLKPGRD